MILTPFYPSLWSLSCAPIIVFFFSTNHFSSSVSNTIRKKSLFLDHLLSSLFIQKSQKFAAAIDLDLDYERISTTVCLQL